jgi:glycosyltransferase involved in cell wall biosynthesis
MLEGLTTSSATHGQTKMPRVFIGMPVFNGCPFVEEALLSLTTQTFLDWRLLIADNGSTDATADVCKRFADADNRITYVRRIARFVRTSQPVGQH